MARFDGRERMRRVLKALPDQVRKKIRQAILDESEKMAQTMRRLAPVDTGKLRDSIVVVPATENPRLYQSRRSRRTDPDLELAALVYSELFYAPWKEFGTAPHRNEGEFKGTTNPGTRAEPFFFPGFRARKKAAIAKINRAARQGIKDGLK